MDSVVMEVDALSLVELAVTTVSPVLVVWVRITSVLGVEVGSLVVTTLGSDLDGLGGRDIAVSARVIPHVDVLRAALAVSVPVSFNDETVSSRDEGDNRKDLCEMHFC